MVTKNGTFVLNTVRDILTEAGSMDIKLTGTQLDQVRKLVSSAITGNEDFWNEYYVMIQNCITEINNKKIRKEIMGEDYDQCIQSELKNGTGVQ